MGVGDRCQLLVLETDFFPGRRVRKHRTQQLVVQLVARLVAVERADEAVPEQVQVADRIEDLVLDELVLVAQAVLVEDPIVVEHDRVVHRAAQREVALAQHLDVAHEAERADRKSTRLNSSHGYISYAVFCLKKKKKKT